MLYENMKDMPKSKELQAKVDEYERDPRVIKRRKERDDRKRVAIKAIRDAGMFVNLQSSNMVIDVICEDIEVKYRDGIWTMKIDGKDMTDQLVGMRVVGRMYNFPSIMPTFRPKARSNLNTDEKPIKNAKARRKNS